MQKCSLLGAHLPRRKQRARKGTREVSAFLALGDRCLCHMLILPLKVMYLPVYLILFLCSILKQGWLILYVILFFFLFLCKALVLDDHIIDLLV